MEGMIDTLDIFLESDGNDLDKENYSEIMLFLRDELKNKSSSLLKYIQDLQAKSKIVKEESDRLLKLSKARLNKAERLTSYLANTLQTLEMKKIETDLGSYGLRRSSVVDICDMAALPDEFIRVTEERKADNYSLQIR